MNRPRTELLLAIAVAFSVVVAGCAGSDGGEPVRTSGSPASFEGAPLEESDYDRAGRTNRTLNATLTVTIEGDIEGRESKDVRATIPVSTYRAAGDPPSVVAVASSPLVEVIENPPESEDPLNTLSTSRLVEFVQSTYAEPTDLEAVSERSVTALGSETTLVTYAGSASVDGRAVDVRVHVVRVEHDGDVVTVVGIGPAGTDGTDRLVGVLEGLEH